MFSIAVGLFPLLCFALRLHSSESGPSCVQVELRQNCRRSDDTNWAAEYFVIVTGPNASTFLKYTLDATGLDTSFLVCPEGGGMHTISCEPCEEKVPNFPSNQQAEVFWTIRVKSLSLLGTVHTRYLLHFDERRDEWFLVSSENSISGQPLCGLRLSSIVGNSSDAGAVAASARKLSTHNKSCFHLALLENCNLKNWCGAGLTVQRSNSSKIRSVIYRPRPGASKPLFDICDDGGASADVTLSVVIEKSVCSDNDIHQSVFWAVEVGSSVILGGASTTVQLSCDNGDWRVITSKNALRAQPICSASALNALSDGVLVDHRDQVRRVAAPSPPHAQPFEAESKGLVALSESPPKVDDHLVEDSFSVILHLDSNINPDISNIYALQFSIEDGGHTPPDGVLIAPLLYVLKAKTGESCPTAVTMLDLSSGGGVISPSSIRVHSDGTSNSFKVDLLTSGCFYMTLSNQGSLAWVVPSPLVEFLVIGDLSNQQILLLSTFATNGFSIVPPNRLTPEGVGVERRLESQTSFSSPTKYEQAIAGTLNFSSSYIYYVCGISLFAVIAGLVLAGRKKGGSGVTIASGDVSKPSGEHSDKYDNNSFIYDIKEAQELLRSLSNDSAAHGGVGKVMLTTTIEISGNTVSADRKTEVTLESWGGCKTGFKTLPDGSMIFRSSSSDIGLSRSLSLDAELSKGNLAEHVFDRVLRVASSGSVEGEWLEAQPVRDKTSLSKQAGVSGLHRFDGSFHTVETSKLGHIIEEETPTSPHFSNAKENSDLPSKDSTWDSTSVARLV